MDARTSSRPAGVVLVAVLLALSAIGALVTAFPVMSPGITTGQIVLNVLFFAVLMYLAWGVFTLRPWAWSTALVIQAINALFSIVAIGRDPTFVGGWLSLAISIAVLVYFSRPHVREAFGKLAPPV